MIQKDFFRSKLKKAGLLSGRLIDIEIADALYEELKDEDANDLLLALKDVAYGGEIINLANIFKHLTKHKSDRLYKENSIKKKQEEVDIRNFLKKEGLPDEIKNYLKNLKKM